MGIQEWLYETVVLLAMTYFLFGFFLDVIITAYTLRIVEKKAGQAALLSILITIINLFVYDRIITSGSFLVPTLAFAAGCGLGTYITIKKNPR